VRALPGTTSKVAELVGWWHELKSDARRAYRFRLHTTQPKGRQICSPARQGLLLESRLDTDDILASSGMEA
jgi:hypothetical protein